MENTPRGCNHQTAQDFSKEALMRIRKATEQEKREWAAKKELYPLFGFVSVATQGTKGRIECAVEYLGEGEGEPNYEAHAPDGMHFYDGDALHTMLGTTQSDLLNRLGHLQKCSPATCDVQSDGSVRPEAK